jgi:hypothetical protein
MTSEPERVTRLAASESGSREMAAVLGRGITLANALSSPAADRLTALRERLLGERFQLAVLGQFKRGKSTLINALLGAPILPTGIVPLTAVPTFISWGPKPSVSISYGPSRPPEVFDVVKPEAAREILFHYVAEEGNPRNELGVARVDLHLPATVLRHGLILIDTPGVGSTNEHNTEAALEVLPECDAAIFVTSADPPITKTEVDYLKLAEAKAARLYFVLNKSDNHSSRDLDIAARFLRDVIVRVAPDAGPPAIFRVSSLAALQAKQADDPAKLSRSGIGQIENELLTRLEKEKVSLLRGAIAARAQELIAELHADTRLRLQALAMPLDDLERRAAQLSRATESLVEEGRAAQDQLAGDKRRLASDLEDFADEVRQGARRHFEAITTTVLKRSSNGENLEAVLGAAFSSAAASHFEREFSRGVRKFGRMTEAILTKRADRIDRIVNEVRKTTADLFEVPYVPSSWSEKFQLRDEPYWVDSSWDGRIVKLPSGFLARLLPSLLKRSRQRKIIEGRIHELVQRNVENLRWAILQAANQAFIRFEGALIERISSALAVTHGAVKDIAALRDSRSADATVETKRLLEIVAAVEDLLEAIRSSRVLDRQPSSGIESARGLHEGTALSGGPGSSS